MAQDIPPDARDDMISTNELRNHLYEAMSIPNLSLATRNRLRLVQDMTEEGSAATPDAAAFLMTEIDEAIANDD